MSFIFINVDTVFQRGSSASWTPVLPAVSQITTRSNFSIYATLRTRFPLPGRGPLFPRDVVIVPVGRPGTIESRVYLSGEIRPGER